jgi:hypothetical protein
MAPLTPTPTEYVHSIYVVNRDDRPLDFLLEPDAEEFVIPPSEKFKITGRSPEDGAFEVVFYKTYVAVWPWAQTKVTILHNGVELGGHETKR